MVLETQDVGSLLSSNYDLVSCPLFNLPELAAVGGENDPNYHSYQRYQWVTCVSWFVSCPVSYSIDPVF